MTVERGVNTALRAHVTSIGFALTLSKRQIETLVLMHHFGGFDKFFNHRLKAGFLPNYCTTARALVQRGLLRDHGPGARPSSCEVCEQQWCDHKLTKAGVLAADLLKEAGIYQDVLARHDCGTEGAA